MTTVWIDADNCMGAGTCSQIVPDVFHARADGIWAVKESERYFGETVVFDGGQGPGHGPDGIEGAARVPAELHDLVIEAAEECPAECIFIGL